VAETRPRADTGGIRYFLVVSVALAALAATPWLLPSGGDDYPVESAIAGQPCIVFAPGDELCGHDAAAWCDMHPGAEVTRDACIRVLRWSSDGDSKRR
jgi:hypothetical protein